MAEASPRPLESSQLDIHLDSILSKCLPFMEPGETEALAAEKQRMDAKSSLLLSLLPALSITSSVLSLGTLILIVYAMNTKRLPSRKYSAVFSRLLADCFSSVLISLASLLASKSSASLTIIALFLCITSFGFVQIALSHLMVILLRHISLSRPHGFPSLFSFRKLLFHLALIWIVSILYAAGFAPLTTVVLKPALAQSVCSFTGCQRPLLAISIAIIGFLLICLLASFSYVLYRLWRIVRIERSLGGTASRSTASFYRFVAYGSHIVLFILISALLIAGLAIVLHNSWVYEKIRREDSYNLVEYLRVLLRLESVAGGAVVLWLVRILADILILFLQDYRRLIPCIARRDEDRGRLRDHDPSRVNTLHRSAINRPVFTMDKPSATTLRN